MCIRDRLLQGVEDLRAAAQRLAEALRTDRHDHAFLDVQACLLYTSDAADERSSVDLGGRRIIKKTKRKETRSAAADDIGTLKISE